MNKRFAGMILLICLGFYIPITYFDQFSNVIKLHEIKATETINILVQLSFYALIIERITEIYIDSSFSGHKAKIKMEYLDEEIQFKEAQRQFAQAKGSADVNLTRTKLVLAQEKLDDIKLEKGVNTLWSDLTEKIKLHAILFSVSAGILFSLVGIRILGQLPAEHLHDISQVTVQNKLSRGTDIVITGLLLAGGAAGLHPIVNSLKNVGKS